MRSVLELARADLRDLQPYRHAEWQPSLERLHANELPWRMFGDNSQAGLNRYPEPQPRALVERLAALYGTEPANVLVGRGSDEAIDLLVRAFCRAEHDAVVISPPTFGMYEVAARIQGAGVLRVPLERGTGFAPEAAKLLDACTAAVKIVFVCSPNNPTGNLIERPTLERLCTALAGKALVVVDEAYLEFAQTTSAIEWIARFPHLVVLRTLSKAFGLAGARCGVLVGNAELVDLLRRMIPPYAITAPTIEAVLHALEPAQRITAAARVEIIIQERARLAAGLARSEQISRVWPSAANFLLVDCVDAQRVLEAAAAARLLVRDVRAQSSLGASLRITVGTPEQNDRLIAAVLSA